MRETPWEVWVALAVVGIGMDYAGIEGRWIVFLVIAMHAMYRNGYRDGKEAR